MVFAAWGNPAGPLMFLASALTALLFVINVPSTLATTSGGSVAPAAALNGRNDVFTSSFLVRFRRSVDNDLAGEVAARYGFDNIGAAHTSLIVREYMAKTIIQRWPSLHIPCDFFIFP